MNTSKTSAINPVDNLSSSVGWMDEFGFRKEDIKKNFEEQENEIFKLFQRKLKCWGYFAITFSAYTLLNAFIEFSSAPFYELKIDCYAYHPSHKCQILEDKT
jgi:hypothetical protein